MSNRNLTDGNQDQFLSLQLKQERAIRAQRSEHEVHQAFNNVSMHH